MTNFWLVFLRVACVTLVPISLMASGMMGLSEDATISLIGGLLGAGGIVGYVKVLEFDTRDWPLKNKEVGLVLARYIDPRLDRGCDTLLVRARNCREVRIAAGGDRGLDGVRPGAVIQRQGKRVVVIKEEDQFRTGEWRTIFG
jgi:hypothetical protein